MSVIHSATFACYYKGSDNSDGHIYIGCIINAGIKKLTTKYLSYFSSSRKPNIKEACTHTYVSCNIKKFRKTDQIS